MTKAKLPHPISLMNSKATPSASPASSDHSDYDPWGGPCAQDPYDYWVKFLLLVVIQKKKQKSRKEPAKVLTFGKSKGHYLFMQFLFCRIPSNSHTTQSQGPERGYQWSFKPSTWPSSIQKIKEQFNVYDIQRRQAINSMSTLHVNVQEERFKKDV